MKYFDVDEFNDRLSPLKTARARAASPKSRADDAVEVNAVFFTAADGSLIQAGSSKFEENKLPSQPTSKGQQLGGQRLQVSFVLLALVAMTCVLALLMFLVYYNRMEEEDEEEIIDVIYPEDDVSPPAVSSTIVERDGSSEAATKADVDIEVPVTPQHTVSDMSSSDLSTLSESPFMPGRTTYKSASSYYCHGLDSDDPSTLGLGISNPSRFRYSGDCSLGFAAEHSWQQQQQSRNWEVYQDPIVKSP